LSTSSKTNALRCGCRRFSAFPVVVERGCHALLTFDDSVMTELSATATGTALVLHGRRWVVWQRSTLRVFAARLQSGRCKTHHLLHRAILASTLDHLPDAYKEHGQDVWLSSPATTTTARLHLHPTTSHLSIMQFTKAVSLFALFFLGLVGFVAAGPVQRDVDSSVLAVVNTLQSSVASPLSNIGAPYFTSMPFSMLTQ
jgi:hypothetical protein